LGKIKLNTDRYCKDGIHAAYGGLIRGADGDGSAFITELWGVLERLK